MRPRANPCHPGVTPATGGDLSPYSARTAPATKPYAVHMKLQVPMQIQHRRQPFYQRRSERAFGHAR